LGRESKWMIIETNEDPRFGSSSQAACSTGVTVAGHIRVLIERLRCSYGLDWSIKSAWQSRKWLMDATLHRRTLPADCRLPMPFCFSNILVNRGLNLIWIGSVIISLHIRIGLVARICRSQLSKDNQFRQGRGSIPRFGNCFLTSWRPKVFNDESASEFIVEQGIFDFKMISRLVWCFDSSLVHVTYA
jgi:hypothetical protein